FQPLLRKRLVAVGKIEHGPQGAIRKRKGDVCPVLDRLDSGHRSYRHRVNVHNRRPGKEAQQIDEMTALANNSTTANALILRPMAGWNGAGVYRHDEGLGFMNGVQEDLHLLHVRSKATVKSNHQPGLATECGRSGVCSLNLS